MGVISTELTAARDLALNRFITGVTGMKVGDDGTAFSESDTDIGNLLEEANLQGTDTSVSGQVTYTTKYGITSFVGDTLREVVLKESTGDIKTRNLTVEALKGSDQIFWCDITVKVTSRNK